MQHCRKQASFREWKPFQSCALLVLMRQLARTFYRPSWCLCFGRVLVGCGVWGVDGAGTGWGWDGRSIRVVLKRPFYLRAPFSGFQPSEFFRPSLIPWTTPTLPRQACQGEEGEGWDWGWGGRDEGGRSGVVRSQWEVVCTIPFPQQVIG